MERQHFPVGIETFSDIIESEYVYVDKIGISFSPKTRNIDCWLIDSD